MREILFRGKSQNDSRWIIGDLLQHMGGETYIINNRVADTVDPSTVGQYTGLKDKNGKWIYEGDIVRCGTGRMYKVTFFVSPGVCGFDLAPIGGFDSQSPHNWSLFADTVVIGNIYDNPELLKGEDNDV